MGNDRIINKFILISHQLLLSLSENLSDVYIEESLTMAMPRIFLHCRLSSSLWRAGLVVRLCHSSGSGSRTRHVAHLAVLGLPATADREAVRQRYIELVKIHHPDTSSDPDTVDKFR